MTTLDQLPEDGHQLRIMCGPHSKKRRGSHTATVALAELRPRFDGIPFRTWTVAGIVEQRVYRLNGQELYDEYVSPLYRDLEEPVERSRFDRRWEDAQDLIEAEFGAELGIRRRAVLRCPVCPNAVAFAEDEELYQLLDRIAVPRLRSIPLDELRYMLNAHRAARADTTR